MKPKNPSYIGITDFTKAEQVHQMRDVLDAAGSERLLGVGVMMSYKTLNRLETKWSKWFPPNQDIADIFVWRKGVFNVLHYADYDNKTTFADLVDALYWAGKNVHAIQLDMIWPDPLLLRRTKEHAMDHGKMLKFIIQVNEKAIEACEQDMHKVAAKLTEYQRNGCLDYALFDLSSGQGKPMQATLLMSYIWKAVQALPNLSVAVAGGLGPSSMELLAPALRDGNPLDVSIDAQSKLRPSGKADLEPVDWTMAAQYLRAAETMFRNHQT